MDSKRLIAEYIEDTDVSVEGWLWMPGVHPKEMTLSLGYFTGDVVYNTEE